jgi:hypothetical protein
MKNKKWTYFKTFGMYVITNGSNQIKIGYLKNISFNDILDLLKELNEYCVEKNTASFYLTDYANVHSMQLFDSVFIGYETEPDECNRINVFNLEYPIVKYIGKMKKYISTYFIETN